MKTVLLIEDNDEMRENTSEILELSNYIVITAKNGKEGVEQAKSNSKKIDVILSDIMMPELDGYGVLHILSKLSETKNIPFIFLSAKAEKQDFRAGMNLGADDYLIKPFTEIELLNAIEKRIERKQSTVQYNGTNTTSDKQFRDAEKGIRALLQNFNEKRTMSFKKRESVFHEGDYPSYLYLVKTGAIKTYKINKEGKELIVDIFSKGDILDVQSLMLEEPFGISAQAIEKSEMAVLSRNDLLELIHSNADICSYLLQQMAQKARVNDERMLNMAYDSVRKRVARGILMTFNKHKIATGIDELALSREDLANIVGTSTESVIRTLHDFKEEGLLAIEGRNIVLLNPKALKEVRS